METFKSLSNSLYEAARLWLRLDMDYYAAAFSYYAPFTLVPLVVLSLFFTGLFYGTEFVVPLFNSWGMLFGADVLQLINVAVDNLNIEASTYQIPVLAIIILSFVSVAAFNVLATGFQRLWGDGRVGFLVWLQKSLRSVIFILIIQAYLIIVIGFEGLFVYLGLEKSWALSTLVLLIFTTVMFTLLYRGLSLNSPAWTPCFIGAVVASALFIAAKYFVVFYLAVKPVLNLFGTAGLILVLLVWIYIIACIIHYGAAVAQIVSRRQEQTPLG